MRNGVLLAFLLSSFLSGNARDFDFVVANPASTDRCNVVEVESFPSGDFVLCDQWGNRVAYQLTHDSKLVFKATVSANSEVGYYFESSSPAATDTICYGRVFPERKDDLAWENDCSAYRAYGPALQASGERAFGYDIWTKSVSYPILEKRFHDDIVNKISFHKDHGNGMDVYAVGPTLGGGTSAILTETDSIIYPYCWEMAEILNNGPLRFTARLTYPSTIIDGDTIVEQRLITLDAGSHMNKTVVTYKNLKGNMRPVAGIVVHEANADGYVTGKQYATYCDLTQQPNNGNGEIYIALVSSDLAQSKYMPLNPKAGDAVGHILLVGNPGQQQFTYYWGSGWSKGGVKDFDAWNLYVAEFEKDITNPLIVKSK